jgi:hypothetical protein
MDQAPWLFTTPHYPPDQFIDKLLRYPDEKCFIDEIMMIFMDFSIATLTTHLTFYQIPVIGATISWLFQARLDCNPHRQVLLILTL